MNKRGDFYTSYETILSIPRVIILIIFALAMSGFIGFFTDKEVTTWDLEAKEVFNGIISCATTNHGIDETKLDSLERCLKTREYGVEVSFKDKKYMVNKEKFGDLFGLCNTKSIYCLKVDYLDGLNPLEANILVMKNE